MWVKGQSGNPGGRARVNREVADLLKAASPKAARKLIGLLDSDDPKIVHQAAVVILDRTQGKPVSTVHMSARDGTAEQMEISALDQVTARIASIIARQQALGSSEGLDGEAGSDAIN